MRQTGKCCKNSVSRSVHVCICGLARFFSFLSYICVCVWLFSPWVCLCVSFLSTYVCVLVCMYVSWRLCPSLFSCVCFLMLGNVYFWVYFCCMLFSISVFSSHAWMCGFAHANIAVCAYVGWMHVPVCFVCLCMYDKSHSSSCEAEFGRDFLDIYFSLPCSLCSRGSFADIKAIT